MTVNKYTFIPGTEISGTKSTTSTTVKKNDTTTSSTTGLPAAATSFQSVLDGLSSPQLPEKDLSKVTDEVKKAQETGDLKKLRETAQDMESMFVNMMFKSMRSTVDTSGLIEKSYGREVFEDMYYEEVSNKLSKGKGLGLSDMIYKDLVKMYNQSKG